MAITDLQLSDELTAGAPSIKYQGDMRPETQMASYGYDDAMAESFAAFQEARKNGLIPPTLTFDEYLELMRENMAQGGSIRQAYGLGSIVKKIGRGIKKVIDNPIVQSALMLNPATAPYAMTYSGIRSLQQGNPMGALMAYQGMNNPNLRMGFDSVKPDGSNVFGIAKRAMTQDQAYKLDKPVNDSLFGKIRDALFYKKGTDKIDPLKVAIGAGAGLLGIGALQKRANEKQPKIEDMIGDRGSKIGLDDIQMKVQAAIDSGDKETYENLKVTENLAFLPPWESIQKADGGRIGYASGGQTSAEMLQLIERLRAEGKTELEIQQILQQMFQNRMSFPGQGIQSIGQSGPASFVDTVITETGAGGIMPRTTDIASIRESAPIMKPVSNRNIATMGAMKRLPDWTRDATEVPQRPQRPQEPLPEISPYGAAQGGRINKAGGGIMSMGGMEMDLRGGGFVPIGKAEKADDVPARLSKNEFVFTADAVRAAGGGDVDRGADKMYRTMKQLESRVA